jgi:lactate permease
MLPALALAPIALILVLMAGLRWPAAKAGPAGFALALVLALAAFGYGVMPDPGEPGLAAAVAGPLVEAGFIALTILWIIFPALCIHELQTRGGAIQVLRTSLVRLSPDPAVTAILIAWFFSLFVEGAAGFGTPIALAAPILVALGFGPVRAVAMVLIGHAAGVSFGAVGTPIVPQAAATEFSPGDLAMSAGLLNAALGWMMLLLMLRLVPVEGEPARRWRWAAPAALLFLVPYAAIAVWVGPELPTLGGALIGGLAFVLLLRRFGAASAETAATAGPGELAQAALPYLVLVCLILLTRLTPPLRDLLQAFEWGWDLPGGFAGSMQPLYHPGTMLMLGFVLGGLGQGRRGAELATAMVAAGRRLLTVVVALLAMLGLARVMVHAGMIDALAEAAADLLGPAWPLLAPAVGVLGTFVTGSATASNVLFTDFQATTATTLGLPVLLLVGAQCFGAAVGNIICPHNIIAGGATVGLAGREGEVLKTTLVACLAYAAAGGALVWLLI